MGWLCGDCEHYKNLNCEIGIDNCSKLLNVIKNINKRGKGYMKIMRIHYCIACKYNRYFMETAPIRAKCCHPKAKTKKGNYRILNKRLMTLGHFPKWCPLENWPEKYGDIF